MKNQPLVSVIMNCHNGEDYLKEAIESVLSQSYKKFEIIFWDNVSTDKSRGIVESYDDVRIKYFLADEHVLLGEARNCALKKAKGKYIAFLDVDDLWAPNKIEQQIQYFKDSSIGLVYSVINKINFKGDIVLKNTNRIRFKFFKKSFIELFEEYDITMSSAIISSKALMESGFKFDSTLTHSEEYDLFMRVCTQFNAIRVEEVLAYYRVHKKQNTLYQYERSIFEEEYIISKLIALHPDLLSKDSKLLKNKYGVFAWRHFLNLINKKMPKQARKKLFPHIHLSLKYISFYLLSFISINVIMFIWNLHRKKNRIV